MTVRTATARFARSTSFTRKVLLTVPVLLVGTMAATLGATPAHATTPKPHVKPKTASSELGRTLRAAVAASAARATAPALSKPALSTTVHSVSVASGAKTAAAPVTYRVVEGDTVSSISARFGLPTASVLALNGLGWKTMIFPGQELRLGKSTASAGSTVSTSTQRHTVVAGDTISAIAARYGVATTTVLSVNGLSSSSLIFPGQKVTIPSGSTATISTTNAATVSPIVSTASKKKSYVIATGDTISSIASRFGVPSAAILAENALSASSIIYAGRSIVIPPASAITTLSPEMRVNARTIIQVGKQVGASDYGIVVALAAAMQESGLRNLNYGHLDSVGLFQQRPSAGWGTAGALQSPTYSARLFYGGATNPNAGVTKGLLDIPGWKSMSVTQAAQAVQVSAHPGAYAQWEKSARSWLRDLD
jgi:LysM repeat protein